MNPYILQALEVPTSDTPIPAAPSAGYGEILGKNLGNLIPRGINSLGGSLEGILNIGAAPSDKVDVPEVPLWMKDPSLGATASKGEQLTNLLTQGVLPELAALFIPYAGGAKLARAAGLGEAGQALAGNALQGAIGGIKYGPEEAVEGAVLGGGLSAIGTVPGVLRRAAITAPIAGLEYGLHQDEGSGQAATAAATTLLGGILPSISRGPKDLEVLSPETPLGLPYDPRRGVRSIPTGETILNHPADNTFAGQLTLPGPATSPDARYWNMLEWPHGEARTYVPSGEPIPMTGPEPMFMPEKRASFDIPIIGGDAGPLTKLLRSGPLQQIEPPEVTWIVGEMPGLALSHGVPRSNVRTPPTIDIPIERVPSETVTPNMVEATKEAATRGKMHQLPEYQRTQGGIVVPELLNTLGQSAVGGLVGAGIDANIDSDFNFTALGAGLPITRHITGLIPEALEQAGISNKLGMALYPKYKTLAVDRSGNLQGVMREQGHGDLNMGSGAIDARVQGDTLHVLAPKTALTPRQLNTLQAFANDHNLNFQTTDRSPGMQGSGMKTSTSENASVLPETISSLAGGAVGGLTGYAMSEGDPYAAGAGILLGATGGAALASAFKSPGMQQTAVQIKQEAQGAKALATSIPKTGKTATDLTNLLKTASKDLTEGNTYGQGGPLGKFFDFADKQFRVTMTPEVKATITHARGEVARLSERAVAYIKPYLSSGTPTSLVDRANRYLDGIGNSVTDEVNFVRTNGGIDDIAYDQLQPTARKGYTTWRISEDTSNPKGVGPHQAFKMHVPIVQLDSLKNQWNQKLTTDFLSSVNPDEKPVAEAIVKARGNFNEIQRIFERALPAGPTQALVSESVGRYVPRLFRAFTDPNFKVSDADVKGYLNEFGLNKRADALKEAVASGEAYDATTLTNLLNKPNQSAANQARLQQYVQYTVDGQNVGVLPHIKDRLESLQNDVHLENMVRSHLQELGASERMQSTGAASGGLDPTMFKRREDLTPGYRKLLGEFTDPIERMAMAYSRTFAPAQAASLMDLAKNIQLPSGLKSAYEPAEWAQALDRAVQSGDQKLAQELKQMKLIGKSATFGEYAGNYVNRHLADFFEGGSQLWNQSIGRGIAEFNKIFKTGHVPLNPISHIRQIVSIPAFLAIGKAAPQDVRSAWNALFAGAREEGTSNALIRDELLSVGAWTSDLIKGELQGNIDTFLSGRYDSELMKATKIGVNSVLEAYRKPDMLVRAATYLGAKRRALESGLSSDEAKSAAIQWMDRYTMNYDNIAPAVRFMRNIPGVSPFISYQSEMLRLVKNMLADGISGNPERLGTLATITGIPMGAAMVAENNLSPEDKKEWARTKAMMPDYNKGRIVIPTGKNPNGSMKYWDISPDIAHSDLIRLVSNLATGNTGAALEQNPFVGTTSSPILQAIAKVTTRRDPRTGQELGTSSDAALSAVSDILPPITPGLGYEWKRLANVEVENVYTGKKESWGDWATRLATGATGSSVRLNTLQDSLKKEFSRTAANARAEYLRTAKLTGENPGLEARKLQAYEEYRQTMAEALKNFQRRFQPL